MADNRPVKYSDPYWVNLAAGAEKRAGIPSGLLQSILLNGERTNADRVSDAGARTPFQIIPATRAGAVKKYGVDPYLNDENAAYVAALHLRDSLKANNGDIAAAAGEYHAGPNRKIWGPKTRAYIERVTAGMGDATPAAPKTTYERMQGAEQTKQGPTIADVYKRYKSGQMSEEQRKAFEADVENGRLMLPRGAMVSKPKSAAIVLPEEISRAYLTGKMTKEQKDALEEDMKAGAVQLPTPKEYLAKESIEGLRADFGPAASLPTAFFVGVKKDANGVPLDVPKTVPILGDAGKVKQPEPTFGERLVGTGEAVTSLITAVPSAIGGGIEGLQSIIESPFRGTFGTQEGVQEAEKKLIEGMQATTYQPRTQQGQQQLQTAGEVIMNTLPVMPAVTGIEGAISSAMPTVRATAGAAGQALRESPEAFALRQAQQVVSQQAGRAAQVVRELPTTIRENMPRMPFTSAPEAPTPGTMGSAGAGGVDIATLRQQRAGELPVEIPMTKGQATRAQEQIRFERETAKMGGDIGTPLLERYSEQHLKAKQNLEMFLDETGAEAMEPVIAGERISKAAKQAYAQKKAKVDAAYQQARQAGELEQPVVLTQAIDSLNKDLSGLQTTAVQDAARAYAVKIGLAEKAADGSLVAKPVPLESAFLWRQEINNAIGNDKVAIRAGARLKQALDADTATAGGALYQRANRLRAQLARDFEDRAIVANLLENKKGTLDRKVAAEDVTNKIVFGGSLEDAKHLRKVLMQSGEEGRQAWREVQGAAARYVRDEATKNVARDYAGREIINPVALDKAIRTLEQDGKLEFLFGKQGAEKYRILNDVAKDLFTDPPGSVGTSNTASVILAAMDMGITASAGMPLPVMTALRAATKHIKNKKIKARVAEALNYRAPQ